MKTHYATILFTSDYGPGSRRVFRSAVLTARLHGAALHVLHVDSEVEEAVVQSVATVMGGDKLINEEKEYRAEQKEALSKHFLESGDPGLQAVLEELEKDLVFEVRSGRPVATILAYADEIQADLIVIGARRRGAMRSSLLRAVAERLLRRTARPVLVIPPEDADGF